MARTLREDADSTCHPFSAAEAVPAANALFLIDSNSPRDGPSLTTVLPYPPFTQFMPHSCAMNADVDTRGVLCSRASNIASDSRRVCRGPGIFVVPESVLPELVLSGIDLA